MSEIAQMIVPSPEADWLSLARTQKGRLFRKHILNKGDLLHPKTGKVIKIDDDFVAKLMANFESGACDIVQVPKAGANNEHTEDPDRNIGEVIGLEEHDGKVYALIDARTDADALGQTLLGASAMMHMSYCVDAETEILTRRGWLRWDQVQAGDSSLAIDPDTGLAGWQVIESVFREHRDCQMVKIGGKGHSSLTTPNHRWLVQDRHGRYVETTTETMGLRDRVPLGAPGAAALMPKYTDALVELVGWYITEGSVAGTTAVLLSSQSVRKNPEKVARIERCLRDFAGAPGKVLAPVGTIGAAARWGHEPQYAAQWRWWERADGCRHYYGSALLKAELDSVAPDRVPTTDFLCALTQAQLELFVQTCVDGDGSRRGAQQFFHQWDEGRSRAFEMAAVLAGYAVSTSPVKHGDKLGWDTVVLRSLRSPLKRRPREVVDYSGVIWCPTLTHHNWLARRDGKTYFTGNTDTRTGKNVGPTLLHVAVTNRPYVVELEDYEELVAASVEGNTDVVLLTPFSESDEAPSIPAVEKEIQMDLDELLAILKTEHQIDVAELMSAASAAEGATQLSNTLAEALTKSGVVKLSNGEEITDEDIVGAVAELATTNVQLSHRLSALEVDKVGIEIDSLVRDGYILPAQRDTFVELKLTNEALFDKLLPAAPVVALSAEKGVTPTPEIEAKMLEDIDNEILRYSRVGESLGYVRS